MFDKMPVVNNSSLFACIAVSCGLLSAVGCHRPTPLLSPCRAQILKDVDRYVSRHIPEAEWRPIIEDKIRAYIEQEKAK
jgi:hypothetical protein